ncbi:hypothetical protein CGCSCA4_v005310 [Colletotrichum siamense]|uniref:Uncharacterized protein n=1 Tax=Colletotrichum siamense TaxID=690259 RepID=A0A9P5EX12_COLSI|nr:hypothetical protein CGCSCA4_v005310 [Colletotrichum siamense]KAF4861236.1 hypothetical protein CGCSCA2_v004772 [Colletotrichum siamense]
MSISLILISTLLQLSSGCDLLDGRKDYANRTYGQTCVEAAANDKESLAVCLLQRNSIDRILDCGNPRESQNTYSLVKPSVLIGVKYVLS